MKLIRAIDLGIFEEQEGYTIYYDDSIDNILGTYATEKRALEILDEIQNTIIGFENENNYVSTQCYAIYEMPSE